MNIHSVAIDGDTVMASAQRSISTSERVNGVYVFQRAADGRWNFQAPLTEGSQYPELENGSLYSKRFRIFGDADCLPPYLSPPNARRSIS